MLELNLLVLLILLKIKFGNTQVSLSELGTAMLKAACIKHLKQKLRNPGLYPRSSKKGTLQSHFVITSLK